MNLIFFQISEVETIGNLEFAGCDVCCFKSYILMYILHFSHCGVRTSVGVYKTVAKEVTVAGRIYTEIASVCPIFFPVFVFLENTLIYPVLRTGQTGARKGQKFWGCSNYPACRYTKDFEARS